VNTVIEPFTKGIKGTPKWFLSSYLLVQSILGPSIIIEFRDCAISREETHVFMASRMEGAWLQLGNCFLVSANRASEYKEINVGTDQLTSD
jgi:hypothetical protein